MAAKLVQHAAKVMPRNGGYITTTLCGRMNARNADGMNIAASNELVTCKFCLAKLAKAGA